MSRYRYGTIGDPSDLDPRDRSTVSQDDSLVNDTLTNAEKKRSAWARLVEYMSHIVPPHRANLKSQRNYESLDYEETESEIEMEQRIEYAHDPEWRVVTLRWVILFFVGILTAAIACGIDVAIMNLAQVKFSMIGSSINKCIQEDCLFQSFFIWLGIDLLLVFIAAILVVYGEPIAAGSGIPEVKCYLNGIKMPHVVRLKTLLVKAFGVTCSVVGGMAVGKEGPMIHSGAVVAAGLSQGKSTSIPFIKTNLFRRFRNDMEKRDFVSGGAAAGVSAAFGAPIGGVLFSLEEGASFWNQFLTWRIFFCSMTATFTLNILLSGIKEHVWGALSNPGLINFGKFQDTPYSFEELPLFALIGVVGGLFGATFNHLNLVLTKFRFKYVSIRYLKVLEVLSIAALSVAIAFILMFFMPDCLPLGDKPESNALQMFCKEGQYSAMASLFFNTPEESIKNLFHSPKEDFQWYTLTLFFLVYFMLACVTYGLSIPSGLFVPCLLTGAAFGRLVGTALIAIFANNDWVDPGKYALIGAAAFLGGVVRMTISLTVIVIEATGNVTYGLPIMVAVIFAKWVGDLFNEGLYDIHIELKHIPLLPWEPPHSAKWNLKARDVMSREVQVLRPIERVGDLYNMLKASVHNAFPVVDWDEKDGPMEENLAYIEGSILRSHLIVMLLNRAFGPLDEDGDVRCDRLTPDEIQEEYPRWPTIDKVVLSGYDRKQYVDLRPYMNPTPYVVQESSSMSRVFRIFRTMGLRHMVVVTPRNQILGIVTRKDIANITSETKKEDLWAHLVTHAKTKYILSNSYPFSSA